MAQQSILDFGCGDGTFLARLSSATPIGAYGCDLDEDSVRTCTERYGSKAHFFSIGAAPSTLLPFPDGFFAAIVMCDVLEHLGTGNEGRVLSEVVRVLKPGGALILTVPHRGMFGWADPENVKFRWPRLHKRLFSWLHGKDEYGKRYGDGRLRFGNFNPGARWHRHYTLAELNTVLCRCGVETEAVRYFGLMFPFIFFGLSFCERLKMRFGWRLDWLIRRFWSLWDLDARVNLGRLSYNIAIRALKPAATISASAAVTLNRRRVVI